MGRSSAATDMFTFCDDGGVVRRIPFFAFDWISNRCPYKHLVRVRLLVPFVRLRSGKEERVSCCASDVINIQRHRENLKVTV